MSTSPVSTLTQPQRTTPADNGWHQFSQLVRVINAGDLPAAQQVYTGLMRSPAADLLRAHPQGRMAQTMDKIGDALQSGDIARAQQALAAIRPRSTWAVPPVVVAAPSISPLEPNAPGGKLDVAV